MPEIIHQILGCPMTSRKFPIIMQQQAGATHVHAAIARFI